MVKREMETVILKIFYNRKINNSKLKMKKGNGFENEILFKNNFLIFLR